MTWSADSAPVVVLLAAGLALGPEGVNVLPTTTQAILDPVVRVALAALGALVGLSVSDRRSADRRVASTAILHAAIVLTVVGVGGAMAGWASGLAAPSFAILGLVCGICAATSLTLPTGNPFEPKPVAAQLAEAGTWLPIVAGGVLLSALRSTTAADSLLLTLEVAAVTVALAIAGWLLLRRTSSPTEERVFAISTLLLIGGAADALSASALFAGLIAGVVWRHAGGRARESLGRDVMFVQHPLLVLVLLVAGARADVSPLAIALGLAYATLRIAGVWIGSALATRSIGLPGSVDNGLALLQPGVFGVAFALNAASAPAGPLPIVLPVVVCGTIVAELIALMLPPTGSRT